MKMPAILLVDEHHSVAESLHQRLKSDFHFLYARQRSELLAMLPQQKIDLAIVEMHFHGGEHGLHLMQLLQAQAVPFMVFSTSPGVALLRAAMLIGARGFVDKRDSHANLRRAIACILNGASFYEAEMLRKITENPLKKLPSSITPTERRVIDQLYFVPKRTLKVIGRELHLAEGTVANRLFDISLKLQVSGREQILKKLLALGYYPEIDPELVELMLPEKVV